MTGIITDEPIKTKDAQEKEKGSEESPTEDSPSISVSSPSISSPSISSPSVPSPSIPSTSNRDVANAVHSMLSHQPTVCLEETFFLPSRSAFESPVDTEYFFLVCLLNTNSIIVYLTLCIREWLQKKCERNLVLC